MVLSGFVVIKVTVLLWSYRDFPVVVSSTLANEEI